MPYMHRKTFEIYLEAYSVTDAEDYFFVDDLMALPIQVLNRKGYTTDYCCSGHPFSRLIEDEIVPDSDPIEYKRIESNMNFDSYIMFNEGVVKLPSLPAGFNKSLSITDKLVIRKQYTGYDSVDVYGYMPVIVETMKQLYEWTLSLPEYNDLS